ncbi:hypothetical protein PTTG_28835 [Puccinia triticina 1-1 BBBD Race 1]|uniref:RING-type E3 ubiquitin transferase n=2 Tax=Puccinia triticina TaxID=208348 RepID=A0A180G8K5_PUCT1|nr:uncharacterized protein PtA15_6A505 [Puccinia triticina]OAV89036.1 hypothetical protein PTTG_28835 [Puccinia triticina 1-1 BBBD Race 1]WAQ85876.1 hypothetical protein PtA15_6A505 [Puccinia triticina]WAR55769.1 hypothetical protein PtB15_6B512 [Puccinia triticina]
MDPSSPPTDSDHADEQPRQGPGGLGPVEEPAEPHVPHPEPEAAAERFEETADEEDPPPPHAEHEAAGEAVVPQTHALPDLADRRAAADARRRAWEQALATLPLEHQVVYRNIAEGARRILEELSEDPSRGPAMSLVEIDDLGVSIREVERIAPSLPEATRALLSTLMDDTASEIMQLLQEPGSAPMTADLVNDLLDDLVNTDLEAIASNSFLRSPLLCTVCLEEYVEGVAIVILPCHPSHHFHRECIHDWLQALVPQPFTCPICRAIIVEHVQEPLSPRHIIVNACNSAWILFLEI